MRTTKVSIRRAVNEAIAKWGGSDISDIQYQMIEWAFEADRKINSSLTYERKECSIEVINHCGAIPADFMCLMGIKYNGQRLEPSTRDFQLFGNGIAPTYSYNSLQEIPVSENYIYFLADYWQRSGVKYSVHNHELHMESVESGNVDISYYGLCLDEEGFPLILDSHTDAVSQYLTYMLSQVEYNRFPNKQGYEKRMMHNKERWHELCGQAYGEDEMPNTVEMEVLTAIWNNMLPLPNLDRI